MAMTKMSEAVETATTKTNTEDTNVTTAPIIEEPECTLSEEQIEQIKSYYARVATNIYNYCKQYNRLDK